MTSMKNTTLRISRLMSNVCIIIGVGTAVASLNLFFMYENAFLTVYLMSLTAKCPLKKCDSTYSYSARGKTSTLPGHRQLIRIYFLIELIDALKTSGKTTAIHLGTQRDSRGKRFEISHLCHAKSDDLCVENTHFELESKATNDRRRSYHNGNDLLPDISICQHWPRNHERSD